MPPEKLISLKQWLDRTALTGRIRSARLKALDDALGKYEKNPSMGVVDVIAAFEAWKAEQGARDAWRSSPRNQGKPIGAFTELEARLYRGGDTDEGIGIASHEALHHRRARLGVLYLFSKMTVTTNLFGLLLDTAGTFAGAFDFKLTATNQLLDSRIKSLPELNTGPAAPFLGGADKVIRGIPQGAAQGGQKMLGGVEKMAKKAATEGLSAVALGVKDPAPGPEVELTVWQMFKDYVRKLVDWLGMKFKSLKTWAPLINAAIRAIVTEICSLAGTLFTDATKALTGLEQTLTAFGNRVASAIKMYDVRLVEGYPAAVVDAVHRSMMLSGAEGLYMVGRGAGGMAMSVFVPVVGKFVGLFLDAAEKLVRFVWRLGEISEMRDVFAVAREQYALGKAYEQAVDARTPRPPVPFHARPMEFARWFRAHVESIPVLAVLTLTSGICGDKMTYLSLYNDDEKLISDKKFLDGAKAIDALKPWGFSYLAKSGYDFHTSDEFVAKLLKAQAQANEDLRLANQGILGKLREGAMTLARSEATANLVSAS